MTGTAKTEEERIMMIYNMRVIEIPTNKPVIRDDRNDKIYLQKQINLKHYVMKLLQDMLMVNQF